MTPHSRHTAQPSLPQLTPPLPWIAKTPTKSPHPTSPLPPQSLPHSLQYQVAPRSSGITRAQAPRSRRSARRMPRSIVPLPSSNTDRVSSRVSRAPKPEERRRHRARQPMLGRPCLAGHSRSSISLMCPLGRRAAVPARGRARRLRVVQMGWALGLGQGRRVITGLGRIRG